MDRAFIAKTFAKKWYRELVPLARSSPVPETEGFLLPYNNQEKEARDSQRFMEPALLAQQAELLAHQDMHLRSLHPELWAHQQPMPTAPLAAVMQPMPRPAADHLRFQDVDQMLTYVDQMLCASHAGSATASVIRGDVNMAQTEEAAAQERRLDLSSRPRLLTAAEGTVYSDPLDAILNETWFGAPAQPSAAQNAAAVLLQTVPLMASVPQPSSPPLVLVPPSFIHACRGGGTRGGATGAVTMDEIWPDSYPSHDATSTPGLVPSWLAEPLPALSPVRVSGIHMTPHEHVMHEREHQFEAELQRRHLLQQHMAAPASPPLAEASSRMYALGSSAPPLVPVSSAGLVPPPPP